MFAEQPVSSSCQKRSQACKRECQGPTSLDDLVSSRFIVVPNDVVRWPQAILFSRILCKELNPEIPIRVHKRR